MYLSEVKKTQTTARVVAYSVSEETGEKIITFEVETPRLIWSEVMTHRIFSRNGASSRAIPVTTVNELVLTHTAYPARFGKKNKGMQDAGSYDGVVIIDGVSYNPEEAWYKAAENAVKFSKAFDEAGYAKQVCNRHTEPYQFMKAVITFTGDGANFFGLRRHCDADPSIYDLADAMKEAMELAPVKHLKAGDWHMPYYKDGAFIKGRDRGLQKALKISASCAAQVSYRKLDDSEEKAEMVYDRLVNSKPVHASPFEHQATPLKKSIGFRSKFVTHVDREGNAWSGNFRNWGQHRQIIPENVFEDKLIPFNEG